jgi:hypothetical protein
VVVDTEVSGTRPKRMRDLGELVREPMPQRLIYSVTIVISKTAKELERPAGERMRVVLRRLNLHDPPP